MSLSTRNPIRMAGASVNSGGVNTGEVQMTLGGAQRATVFSGMASGSFGGGVAPVAGAFLISGADAVLASGPGRLKDVLLHTQMQSGQAIVFYDAGSVVSGGPFSTSGHAIIAVGPPTYSPAQVSGGLLNVWNGTPYAYDIPYNSGLCVNVKSGQPGFTVTFVPETNQSNPAV